MRLTSLLQVVNKLQQACKIDSLQQVCGVLGCIAMPQRKYTQKTEAHVH